MSGSSNNRAKKLKNDEYYTLYKDVKYELDNYKEYFKDKVIYCNCDNPEYSNFWKYFKDNFNKFKLKKLISTYYKKDEKVYEKVYDGKEEIKIQLNGDGDCRSKECLDILEQSDMVVTNPPFSIFREYIYINE